MRLAVLALVAALGAACPTIAAAQAERAPEPVPIEEWSTEKVSAMGKAIYRQDVAAWVSTDVLLAHFANSPAPAGMAGWIVVDEAEGQRVRYVRNDGGTLKAAFDVMVREGVAGPVEPVDVVLSDSEKGQFRARQTALQNVGRLRCGPRPNTVVIDDPDGDGWLVWILAATADANIIPMGGHYRFRISADGSTVLRRDMLSNSCLSMPRQQAGAGDQPVGLVVTQIVSRGPVETHVFLSLQNRIPIYVMAGENRLFEVSGADIRKVDQ